MLLQETGLEKENYHNYKNFCPLFSCETGGFHEQNWRFGAAKEWTEIIIIIIISLSEVDLGV